MRQENLENNLISNEIADFLEKNLIRSLLSNPNIANKILTRHFDLDKSSPKKTLADKILGKEITIKKLNYTIKGIITEVTPSTVTVKNQIWNSKVELKDRQFSEFTQVPTRKVQIKYYKYNYSNNSTISAITAQL